MKLTVVCVGSVRGALAPAVGEYEERAGRYWKLSVEEVSGGAGRGRDGEAERVKEAEESRILPRLPQNGMVVALTRLGRGMSSRELAELLHECALRSIPEVSLVLGGAFGLGDGVLRRADRRLSLSELTLPHELARLVLAEQLYRAGTILRNEPYHKGA